MLFVRTLATRILHHFLPERVYAHLPEAFCLTIVLVGVVAAAFFLCLIAVWLKKKGGLFLRGQVRPDTALALVAVLFSVTYSVFLAVADLFFDPAIVIGALRQLLPIFVFVALGVVSAAWSLPQEQKKNWAWRVWATFVVLVILANPVRSVFFAAGAHKRGLEYNSIAWRNSPTIAAAKLLPADATIFANDAVGISFQIGKRVSSLPAKYDYATMQQRRHFDEQLIAVCGAVLDSGSFIVYFSPGWNPHFPTHADLETRCALPVYGRYADGVIYGNPGRESANGAADAANPPR